MDHAHDPGDDVLAGVDPGDAGRLGDIPAREGEGAAKGVGGDFHTPALGETLGAGLHVPEGNPLEVCEVGGAALHAHGEAAPGLAAPGDRVHGAGGGTTAALVAGAAVAVAALLAAPALQVRPAVEAAGRGLPAVKVPLLGVQGVELPLQGVHIDGVLPGQKRPNLGAAGGDLFTSFFKHSF